MTLTEFLLARIAEDEAVAKDARKDAWDDAAPIGTGDDPWPSHAEFARQVTPARVLARCDADRRIVELWAEEWPEWHGFGSGLTRTRMTDDQFARVLVAERVLGYLALPYADHPDYREEWAL